MSDQPDMKDVTGTPRPSRDIVAALRCLQNEIVKNPMALAKNGEPLLLHYTVICDVLRAELVNREAAKGAT